jgi:hypothetical protein
MAGESAVSKNELSSKLYLLVHFPKHMQNHVSQSRWWTRA